MFRTKSVCILAALAVLGAATLAHAQGGGAPASPAKQGAPATAAKTSPAVETSAKAHGAASGHAAMPKVDLNRATREELMKLPGIAEATADKIIAARPLKSKHELLSKKLVSEKEYQAISSHVVVKQEMTTASKSEK